MVSDIEQKIANILERILDKSSWNRGFCESIYKQVTEGRQLSERQLLTFHKIADSYTPERFEAEKDWKSVYSEEHKSRYEIALEYYKRTAYFVRQRAQYQAAYEANTPYIPSYEDYIKIVENKFASRVLEAHFSKPRYPAGSLVIGRKNNGYHYGRYNDIVMLVISTDMPVVSAAKGAKRYKLLPMGCSKTILMEEREIKTFRKKKAAVPTPNGVKK
tara:strand:- start:1827 stop:2477 length:651 start_codon:yes stop_codon:yes gene_type:complete